MPNEHLRRTDAVAPLAYEGLIVFLIGFLEKEVGHVGVDRLYLMGSRATGVSSKGGPVRDSSDHDFYAVLSNSAKSDLNTGGTEWSRIYGLLNKARAEAGLGFIDLFMLHSSSFNEMAQDASTPAGKAVRDGILIAKRF